MKRVLAIDMGATSIRGIIGCVRDGKLEMEEVLRFSHQIIPNQGKIQWEWNKIVDNIVATVEKYGTEITSMGFDTWGVDFGLLDENGELIDIPISYRDPKHDEGYSLAISQMKEEDIFLNTGNQVMGINTLFQLISFRKNYPEQWAKTRKILMLPDLLQYLMTGEKVGEETIWSTSQILNLKTANYSPEILREMDLAKELFPKITKAGNKAGNTKTARIEALKKYDVDVISVCGHDTASAVLLTEAFYNRDCMFLSCGTWSLVGGLVPEPVINSEAYRKNLTNELGYDSKVMFFKNITGLYLLERFKSQLEKEQNRKIDFSEITEYVQNVQYDVALIDMENELFARPDVNVKEVIDQYIRQTNQLIPQNEMDYFKIIYVSLTNKYLQTKEAIEEITGNKFKKIHMIGGGAKSSYLCQLIADTLEIPVIVGPFEATAFGNILIQLKTVGEIDSIEEGLSLMKQSNQINYYQPHNN